MSKALTESIAAAFKSSKDYRDSDVHYAKVVGLMVGYDARWSRERWRAVSVESPFHVPLVDPDTGIAHETFTLAGKKDGVIRHLDYGINRYLLEHKSTLDDISPGSTYWRRLAIDSQVSAYSLASIEEGTRLEGTLYDVIHKPGTRPKSIPDEEKRKSRKVDGKLTPITAAEREAFNVGTIAEIRDKNSYHGFDLAPYDIPKNLKSGDIEPAILYAARLATDTVANPDKYFAREMIRRTDGELIEFAYEAFDIAENLQRLRETHRALQAAGSDRNPHYRNSGACTQYGTACTYLDVCSGQETFQSDKWERVPLHPELPTSFADGGFNVMTNSRIRLMQTCLRKHYYQCELGIRKRQSEESDALVLGSILHAALEAWWLNQE